MTTCTAKILGTTDEVTTCDCCGREKLAKTVAIEMDGDVVYYGVVCAAKAMQVASKLIRSEAKKADDAKAAAARAEWQKVADAKFASQQAILDGMFPDIAGERNRLLQVMRLTPAQRAQIIY